MSGNINYWEQQAAVIGGQNKILWQFFLAGTVSQQKLINMEGNTIILCLVPMK